MNKKTDFANAFSSSNSAEIVAWDPKYSVGITLLDDQHKELVKLANQLYAACRSRDNSVNEVFKETMRKMVEYVRFHFGAENELLERIGYPDRKEHKMMHDSLIKDILAAVKSFEEGNKFVPNHFVRTLKEWVFGHIAIRDRLYAIFIQEQRKKGLLSEY